jgi:signal transduction histidine kinase/streptogramin lyase
LRLDTKMRRHGDAVKKKNSPRLQVFTSSFFRLFTSLRLLLSLVLILITVALAVSLPQNTVEDTSVRARNLHQWGAVTLFHGLPSDRVRAIAQDRDGLMWFGTDRGLARYDGRRTQAMASEELPEGRIFALKVDDEGVLWVGTETGAARLIDGEFQAIKETRGKAVTAIITPERGRGLLASSQGQIFDCRKNVDGTLNVRVRPEQPLASADKDRPGPLEITSLAFSGETLYAGTQSRGLLTFKGDDHKEILSRPRSFFVNSLEKDAKGRLWIGAKAGRAESGLFDVSDPMRPKKVGASMGTVIALHADAHGDLWVGTDGRGAFRYRDSQRLEHFTFEDTAGGLRSNNIYTILVDREGVVWFGTDKGVCRYDPASPHNEDVSQERESNFVRTLFLTKGGRLLCGTNSGLFVYQEGASHWRLVEEFAGKTIYAIAEDAGGRLLVGSSSGLYTNVDINRKIVVEEEPPPEQTETVEGVDPGASDASAQTATTKPEAAEQKPIESVRAIRIFQGKTYIAIYGRGIERLDGERRTFIWPTDSQADARLLREVTSLYADTNAGLWIGTAHAGAFVYDGKQVVQEQALNKLKGSAVWAIDGKRESGLWFASARGLYVYRAGALSDVLTGVDVRSVSSSDEPSASTDVWCATAGGGLSRILQDKELGTLVSRLDVEQGLSSENAYAIMRIKRPNTGDETLLIGTTRGVVRYNPGKVAPILTPTRILSRRLHQPSELRSGLALDYPQNSLVLDVTALSTRTFPEQFQYAFLLRNNQGQEIKRKFSHDPQFLMENLLPGSYRVEVRAFNKDLVASDPLTFEFSVARSPFPWTIAALSVLLLLAIVALVWAVVEHKRIVRASASLARANHELAGARLELANEAERERRRIARDLHDQTLADLRHLLMLTDQLPVAERSNGHSKQLDANTFRGEIEAVSNEIRRICEDLSPSVLENVGLAAALEWALSNAVAHAPPDCKFEYEFVCDDSLEERTRFAPGVQMQIYRIAQEAVSNICRHANARRVRLNVKTFPEGDFLMTLEDDGRDFDPQSKKKKGRGLANIRARASLIEAEVSWERDRKNGNIFTLRKASAVKDPAEV